MKREDVKKQIPGITEEQLNWIMAENGNDVNREKIAAEQYKTQLENTQAQLKTAQDGLAAFDGKKKPEEYEADIAKLKGDMQAQADGFAFDNALNTAIWELKAAASRRPGTAGSGCPQGLQGPFHRYLQGSGRSRQGEPLGLWRGGRGRHWFRSRFQRQRARHPARRGR